MSSLILKHISEEKDIARYKITLLEKGSKKQYKERLLLIEREFVEYPFEKIGAKTVEDLRVAMEMFRTDRHTFYERYEKKPLHKERPITAAQVSDLRDRLSFYRVAYENILNFDIKELNLIQSPYIRESFGDKSLSLDSHGIDTILEAEGASFAKSRARIQILLYCLARYMHDKVRDINSKISADLSPTQYGQIRGQLDHFFENYLNFLFKNYNNGIEQVPLIINGTLGHNSFVSAVYPLSNLVDKYNEAFRLERVLDRDKVFFSQSGRPVKKKFVERGFCVKTPMRRIGNESITLLYCDLWSQSGVRLTSIFDNNFFSTKTLDMYYKAIPARPIWEWPNLVDNPYLTRELLSLLDMDGPLAGELCFKSKDAVDAVNNCGKHFIQIDKDMSKIMIAATRSESNHIYKALNHTKTFVKDLENRFCTRFKVV